MEWTSVDWEERANAASHGAGAALSVAGLVGLILTSADTGDPWRITSTAIFGTTMILLYTASTLYHSLRRPGVKAALRKFDHAAIFLLIAGTYTPFVLVTLRGPWGWSLFGVVWGLAVVGVTLKFWFTGRFKLASTLIYLGMGWLVLIALQPLVAALPRGGLFWLMGGGLCYTAGTIFYVWKRLPFQHAIWHGWVLAGSACHWVAVYRYVAAVS